MAATAYQVVICRVAVRPFESNARQNNSDCGKFIVYKRTFE